MKKAHYRNTRGKKKFILRGRNGHGLGRLTVVAAKSLVARPPACVRESLGKQAPGRPRRWGTARTARQGLTRMGAGRHACCAPKVNSALLLVLAISRRARTAPPGDIRWQLDYQTYLVAQIVARENTERWRALLTLHHAKTVAVDDFRQTREARGAKSAIRVAVP